MPAQITRLYSFVDDKNNGIPITSARVDAELDQLLLTANNTAIVAATAPSSPVNGELWFDSTNKLLKQYRNSEWVVMGIVHVSSTAPTTTQSGDVWVDTSGSENAYKVRNKANGAWITLQPTLTILAAAYPVGSVYINVSDSTNPATLLGFGTWTALGAGRMIVGYDSGDTNFDSAGETGGANTVTLTTNELPAHTHTIGVSANEGFTGAYAAAGSVSRDNVATTDSSGIGAAFSVLNKYVTCYTWKRTA